MSQRAWPEAYNLAGIRLPGLPNTLRMNPLLVWRHSRWLRDTKEFPDGRIPDSLDFPKSRPILIRARNAGSFRNRDSFGIAPQSTTGASRQRHMDPQTSPEEAQAANGGLRGLARPG